MTHHLQGGVPNHGFTHWWTMFNPRQLLVHAQLLRAVLHTGVYSLDVREFVLGTYQQFLRNQNSFCFWDRDYDKLVPHMSNNNFHPKSNVVENCVFPKLGRGNWASCSEALLEGREWALSPWDAVSLETLTRQHSALAAELTGKSAKAYSGDPGGNVEIYQQSSTDIAYASSSSVDMVITDPPFGGLLHYSELSDFFYVWLRLALKDKYPDYFRAEHTPKSLEAVANRAREPEDPDGFYQRLLT